MEMEREKHIKAEWENRKIDREGNCERECEEKV